MEVGRISNRWSGEASAVLATKIIALFRPKFLCASGIAAGVAALAVVGMICKKKGYLDGFMDKAEDLSVELKDKYKNVKESARKKFDEVVQKGGEIADKIKSHSEITETKTSQGNINPATT